MSFNLSKTNETFNLSKDKPLNIVKVLAKWDQSNTKAEYDLDVFAVPLNSHEGKPRYSNMCYPSINSNNHNSTLNDTIVHGGDEQVGGGEFLTIDLNNVPNHIDKIIVGLNIFEPNKFDSNSKFLEYQNFDMIQNESISIIDMDNDKILASSDSEFIEETITSSNIFKDKASLFEVGHFTRSVNGWGFTSTFKVTDQGLEDYLNSLNMIA